MSDGGIGQLRAAAEQALKRAEAMLREPTETMSNAKALAEIMRQCWLLHGELSAALASHPPAEPSDMELAAAWDALVARGEIVAGVSSAEGLRAALRAAYAVRDGAKGPL